MAQAITIDLLTAEPIAVDDDTQAVTFDMVAAQLRLIEAQTPTTSTFLPRLNLLGVG